MSDISLPDGMTEMADWEKAHLQTQFTPKIDYPTSDLYARRRRLRESICTTIVFLSYLTQFERHYVAVGRNYSNVYWLIDTCKTRE